MANALASMLLWLANISTYVVTCITIFPLIVPPALFVAPSSFWDPKHCYVMNSGSFYLFNDHNLMFIWLIKTLNINFHDINFYL